MTRTLWIVLLVFLTFILIGGIATIAIFAPRSTNTLPPIEPIEPTNCPFAGQIDTVATLGVTHGTVLVPNPGYTQVLINVHPSRFNYGQFIIETTIVPDKGFEWTFRKKAAVKNPTINTTVPLSYPTLPQPLGKFSGTYLADAGYGIVNWNMDTNRFDWWVCDQSNYSAATFHTTLNIATLLFISNILHIEPFQWPCIPYLHYAPGIGTSISLLCADDRLGTTWNQVPPRAILPTEILPISAVSVAIQQKNRLGLVYLGQTNIGTPGNTACAILWSDDKFQTATQTVVTPDIDDGGYAQIANNLQALVKPDGSVAVLIPSLDPLPIARLYVAPQLGEHFPSEPVAIVGPILGGTDVSWSLGLVGSTDLAIFGAVNSGATSLNASHLFLESENYLDTHAGIIQLTLAESVPLHAEFVQIDDATRIFVSGDTTIAVFVETVDQGATWSPQANIFDGVFSSTTVTKTGRGLEETTLLMTHSNLFPHGITIENMGQKSLHVDLSFDYGVV